MSLRIYLDDCISAKALIAMLQADGHDVLTSAQAGLAGEADAVHLASASADVRVLMTSDADDFMALHRQHPQHGGIFAICQDNDSTKDMSFAEIARSVRNIENAGVPIQHQYWVLNAWRF